MPCLHTPLAPGPNHAPRPQVVYEDLPGWRSDISGARSWDDLPAEAKAYIARVEALVGVPCAWIGVGPGRDAIVTQPGTVNRGTK